MRYRGLPPGLYQMRLGQVNMLKAGPIQVPVWEHPRIILGPGDLILLLEYIPSSDLDGVYIGLYKDQRVIFPGVHAHYLFPTETML